MTNIKHVDSDLNIKKGDLIKDALKDAPILEKQEVVDKLEAFLKQTMRKHNFIMLNARDINYVQIFDIKNCNDAKKAANYLYKFFEESGFCTVEEDKPGLIPRSDVKHHPMTNIKDIDIESKNEAGLYIDSVYFKLVLDDWMVEIIS